MPVDLASFRVGLWATLGLAVACGGQSSTEAEENGGSSGSGGRGGSAGTSTGGKGGSSGTAGTGSGGTAGTGVGGTAGTAGTGVGGSAGTAGTSVGGSAGSSGTSGATCVDPEPVLGIDGQPTGYLRCASGVIHRPEPQDCPSIVPRPDDIAPPADAGVEGCTRDEDCTELPYGHCAPAIGELGPSGFVCRSGCVRDSDCEAGQLCFCGDPVGTCVSARCRVDGDCDDALCISSSNLNPCGGVVHEFACEHPDDACKAASDCGTFRMCYQAAGAARTCIGPGACGRPFLVEGEARVAPVDAGRDDWLAAAVPSPRELGAEERAALARYFAECGAMEHASVAAFARFVLDLLALGAPACLVAEATRALGDEVEHAKTCFALASAHAGEPLGPGPLPMGGVASGAPLLDVARVAIVEACIGETLAAAELAATARSVRPELRELIAGIAADEQRHAELGYRFLVWALERASSGDRRELVVSLLQASYDALARDALPLSSDAKPELAAEGMLGADARREARLAALHEVVLPTALALAQRFGKNQGLESRAADSTDARSAA